MNAYYKKALKEIKAIPNCKQTYNSGGIALFNLPYFYVRVLDQDEHIWIQLAEIKTFDRWSNSTDFQTERSKGRKHYYPTFKPQYEWAIKVLKSKLFDFNSYIGTIKLPWFENKRNK